MQKQFAILILGLLPGILLATTFSDTADMLNEVSDSAQLLKNPGAIDDLNYNTDVVYHRLAQTILNAEGEISHRQDAIRLLGALTKEILIADIALGHGHPSLFFSKRGPRNYVLHALELLDEETRSLSIDVGKTAEKVQRDLEQFLLEQIYKLKFYDRDLTLGDTHLRDLLQKLSKYGSPGAIWDIAKIASWTESSVLPMFEDKTVRSRAPLIAGRVLEGGKRELYTRSHLGTAKRSAHKNPEPYYFGLALLKIEKCPDVLRKLRPNRGPLQPPTFEFKSKID